MIDKKDEKINVNESENISKFEFYNSIDKKDQDNFISDYNKINEESKIFLEKYGKKIKMNCYNKGTGYFNPMNNTLYFNLNEIDTRAIGVGFKTNFTTFLHEAGHWLDFNALKSKSLRSNLPELKNLVFQDALTYTNKLLGDKGNIKNFTRNSKKEKLLMKEISDRKSVV